MCFNPDTVRFELLTNIRSWRISPRVSTPIRFDLNLFRDQQSTWSKSFNPDTVRFEFQVQVYTDREGIGFNPDTVRFELTTATLSSTLRTGFNPDTVRFELRVEVFMDHTGMFQPRYGSIWIRLRWYYWWACISFNPDTVRFEFLMFRILFLNMFVSTPIRFDLNWY